jgi:hypothetical protein
MCHEYGMRWWKSEGSEKKRTEETKPDLRGIFAVGEPKVAPAIEVGEEKREVEKELVPAK